MASVPLPPIRNKVDIENRLKTGKQSDIFGKEELQKNTQKLKEDQKKGQGKDEKVLKRDITPMFDYYKAWDSFADVSKFHKTHSIFSSIYRKLSRRQKMTMMVRPPISFQQLTQSQRKRGNLKLRLK